MPALSDAELLGYMRGHKLAVVSTQGSDGPQSALVGIAITDGFQIIFDTLSTSRKHANLVREPRIAVNFAGPAEQTLQYEGVAVAVSSSDPGDAVHREAYYLAWPDGRARLNWPDLVYWRIKARWLRFSDFDRGPLIVERRFDPDVS
jgi:hypothetical protein